MDNLTPRKIVEELDKYIIGQHRAKKAVAIALRNRWRRLQLSPELKDEVLPKKYNHDRADRSRKNRDCKTSCKACTCSVSEDRSHQVYRGGLCRQGR